MKGLILFLGLASTLAAAESDPMLKVDCKPMEEHTGTMHYLHSATYTLDGAKPLTIEENVATGVFPNGAQEIHKLGKRRFLLVGGYSTGGGMCTAVFTIIAETNGALFIQDELEFWRTRRRSYADRVVSTNGAFSIAFPSLPISGEEVHSLWEWEIRLRGERYDLEAIRSFLLTKLPGEHTNMIVFPIDDKGFVLPKIKKTEQGSASQITTSSKSTLETEKKPRGKSKRSH